VVGAAVTPKTNSDRLVAISVQGIIGPPPMEGGGFRPGADGEPIIMLGIGGIVYNVRVGDPAFGWVGDHVEPCASVRNPDDHAHNSLALLSCVGNDAVVMSGRGVGTRGIVTGQHGHILIDFPRDSLPLLCPGDTVVIEALGYGLRFEQFPSIIAKNASPRLIERMGLSAAGGRLRVPVVASVPPYLLGSGIELPSERADVDLMSADRTVLRELGLDRLRLGDAVALLDHDHSFGRGFYEGAMTIAVVVHGDSSLAGHGPGLATLLTSREPVMEPVIDPKANIATYLGIL
jgi:hypothetical protein